MVNEDNRIGGALAAAACGLLGAGIPSGALADENARAWDIDSAILYYGESDGRVKDASLSTRATRDFGDERALSLGLTLDTLTGASPSGAVAAARPQTFTSPSGRSTYTAAADSLPLDDSFKDTRVALDAGWSQPFGRLYTFNAGIDLSNEYDYQHLGINAGVTRDFNRRNTTLSMAIALGQDQVKPVGGLPVPFAMMGDAREDEDDDVPLAGRSGSSDDKQVIDLLLGVTQVLGRHTLLRVNYSYSDSSGYLTDPYKVVTVVDPVSGEPVVRTPPDGATGPGGVYLFERRPDSRTRQGLYAGLRQDFSGKVLDVSYRYSTDDWEVDSHTLEGRLRVPLGEASYLEPHLRYYTQSAASFYRYNLSGGDAVPAFASADARLADLDAYTIGVKFGHRTAGGNEWSARLELYRQEATAPAGSFAGARTLLMPDFDAVILQLNYRFRL